MIGTESCTELINAQACVNAYAGVCSEARLTFTVHQGEGEGPPRFAHSQSLRGLPFLNPGSPAWIGLSMRV